MLNYASRIAAVAALVLGASAQAATFSTVHDFAESPDGAQSWSNLIAGPDGNLYGTTESGGTLGLGTIFQIDSSGNYATAHSFDASGFFPRGRLFSDGSGDLFGATAAASDGVSNLGGSIFRFTPGGGLTTLYTFDGTGFEGTDAWSGVTADASGNLYGTTAFGGASGAGNVYRLDTSNVLTVLHSFDGNDGFLPFGGITIDAAGNLYGTALGGGTLNSGVIFKIDTAGVFTIAHSFSGPDGAQPSSDLLADASGNLYGVTNSGGAFGSGTIFRLNAGGGLTTLHSFSGGDGFGPFGALIADANGNLFGTTVNDNTIGGTVFRLDAGGGLTTLHSFTGVDGYTPYAGLVADANGTLYGTTYFGGANGYGTVYKISNAGFAVVPEPASWAMLIAGFGLVGTGLRIRRRKDAAAFAAG